VYSARLMLGAAEGGREGWHVCEAATFANPSLPPSPLSSMACWTASWRSSTSQKARVDPETRWAEEWSHRRGQKNARESKVIMVVMRLASA